MRPSPCSASWQSTCFPTAAHAVGHASAGELDRSFSFDGRQRTSFAISDYAQALAVQGDDKLVVTGTSGVESFRLLRGRVRDHAPRCGRQPRRELRWRRPPDHCFSDSGRRRAGGCAPARRQDSRGGKGRWLRVRACRYPLDVRLRPRPLQPGRQPRQELRRRWEGDHDFSPRTRPNEFEEPVEADSSWPVPLRSWTTGRSSPPARPGSATRAAKAVPWPSPTTSRTGRSTGASRTTARSSHGRPDVLRERLHPSGRRRSAGRWSTGRTR